MSKEHREDIDYQLERAQKISDGPEREREIRRLTILTDRYKGDDMGKAALGILSGLRLPAVLPRTNKPRPFIFDLGVSHDVHRFHGFETHLIDNASDFDVDFLGGLGGFCVDRYDGNPQLAAAHPETGKLLAARAFAPVEAPKGVVIEGGIRVPAGIGKMLVFNIMNDSSTYPGVASSYRSVHTIALHR